MSKFLCSSINGPLDCFDRDYYKCTSAMNIGVQIFFELVFLFSSNTQTGIVESQGSSVVNFRGSTILFSIMAASICILTNSVRELLFLYILARTYCLSFS